jgi:hypothetical protein
MSRPKRHDFVPRAYLERFALEHALLVRTRNAQLYETGATNIALRRRIAILAPFRDALAWESDAAIGVEGWKASKDSVGTGTCWARLV